MKIKILGIMFLLSALVAGGGIDSGSMVQFLIGALIGFVAGGGLVFEAYKGEKIFDNCHSYPCYLKR